MAKMRVYELAKEMKISSKDLIIILEKYDIKVKSHMSTIDGHQVEWLKGKLKPEEKKEKIEPESGKKADRVKPKTADRPTGHSGKKKMSREKAETTKKSGEKEEKREARKEDKKGRPAKHGKQKEKSAPVQQKKKEKPRTVKIDSEFTVGTFAEKIGVKASEVIKKLMEYGVIAAINQPMPPDSAIIVAEDFGVDLEIVEKKSEYEIPVREDPPESLVERPPIVTVMGHVDHGKTSLLDSIRHTKVTSSEAGGITQHIGAYQVNINGKKITFIDTPGHEAFTAMRARGAQATDIAILVVAADDGVMPQTVEAINHAKAAGIPIVVAINKIDRPNAAPESVKQQLTEYGLVPEEWGGDTICVEISATKGQGIDQLLEMVLLVAEISEIKANPNRMAEGTVIEAELDKGRGPVATLLVQKGTLRIGDSITAGTTHGKVRSMTNDKGRTLRKAEPSVPVQVQGFAEVPKAGERFYVVDEKVAKMISQKKKDEEREHDLQQKKMSVGDMFKQLDEGAAKELNIVLKADVHGTVEAIRQSLEQINTGEVKVNIIHAGVGAVSETDVMLAAASNGIVIGFNVRPDTNAQKAAEKEGVEIKLSRVIYELIDGVRKLMSGLLDPEYKENVLGRVEVRATFKVPKVGTVAGCYVTDGKITNKSKVRLIRDGVVIHEGNLASLKRFKDDAKEVEQGYECGIGIENFNDIKVGDEIEAYIMEEVERTI
jgi:translation initiation factor IF-2